MFKGLSDIYCVTDFKQRRQFNLLKLVLFVRYETRVSVHNGDIYGRVCKRGCGGGCRTVVCIEERGSNRRQQKIS